VVVAHPLLQVMAAAGLNQALMRHSPPAQHIAQDHLEAVVVARNNLIPLDSGPQVATGALVVGVTAGHQARDLRMVVVECKVPDLSQVGMVGRHHQLRCAMYMSRSPQNVSHPSTGAMVAGSSWSCRQ